MNNLIKIRDIALRYSISARTLRYYEDMGLIKSIRSDEYAYRLYDEAAVKRLEQILILRRLDISIKDIRRIFDTAGTEVVLEVLEKKARRIDEETSLLNELKKIILEFIEQIKKSDFEKEGDIRLLYERADSIKSQIADPGSSKTPAAEHFLDVTEKLNDKVPDIMIIRIPPFRAVTSGAVSYEEVFGEFQVWQEAHNDLFTPIIFDAPDLLFGSEGKMEWIWRVKENISPKDVIPYKIKMHPGGLYAAAVSIDGDEESGSKVMKKIEKWLEKTNFIIDDTRTSAVHMIYADEEIRKGLGYDQMNYYVPIRLEKREVK